MADLNSINEPIPPIGGDSAAIRELDTVFSEKKRKERVKNTINWVFIFFIVITSSIAVVIIGIRLIHLVLPKCSQWLTEDQIQGIDKLFFSGAIGGLLVSYFRKSND